MAKAFASPQVDARFFHAYDDVLSRWPVGVEGIDLVSQFGSTHVQAYGPDDAPAVILLSGGGATSTVWFNNVEALSRDQRVYAVDLLGDAGRSVPGGRPVDGVVDLMAWLDSVLDRLGLLEATLVGHSYGGQIALNYAVHAPNRVRSLVLLDPTNCFAGFSRSYLLHAVPLLLRPSAGRMRSLISWETDNAQLDPDWLTLVGLGAADFPKSKPVDHRPTVELLTASTVPTMILLAERSRAHDVAVVARNAKQSMPRAVVQTVPDVSHHGLPMRSAEFVNDAILGVIR